MTHVCHNNDEKIYEAITIFRVDFRRPMRLMLCAISRHLLYSLSFFVTRCVSYASHVCMVLFSISVYICIAVSHRQNADSDIFFLIKSKIKNTNQAILSKLLVIFACIDDLQQIDVLVCGVGDNERSIEWETFIGDDSSKLYAFWCVRVCVSV